MTKEYIGELVLMDWENRAIEIGAEMRGWSLGDELQWLADQGCFSALMNWLDVENVDDIWRGTIH